MDANWFENALNRLKDMPDEMVYAKDIAPILKMKPDVIIKRVKDGIWDPDILGKYVISGDRVKFFRRDFLQKCGFIRNEPERTVVQVLDEILKELKHMNLIEVSRLSIGQIVRYEEMMAKTKETAGAATPAD